MPANPTRIRYLIVLVAMLAAVLLYLERVCVSVADVYIREDLRIGKMEMDAAFGAFFIAYALAQVPSGWLSQRYGPRLMLINDADTQARWWMRLKDEWLAAQAEGRPFTNPLTPMTLRWRS